MKPVNVIHEFKKQNIIPLKNYKKDLVYSCMKKDKPFKVSIGNEETGEWLLKSSPIRGGFVLKSIPYGFYLLGYNGESQITVLCSEGQHGGTVIQVIATAVDGGCKYLSAHVPWDNEEKAVNDMINRLYFCVDTELRGK